MSLHSLAIHTSNNQLQLAVQEFPTSCDSLFFCYLIVTFLLFKSFYEPYQTPWYFCLIEGWPYTELQGRPQIDGRYEL